VDDVARTQGRDREELHAHVRAQEGYAESAHEERNQALYRECFDNLVKYAGYLEQLREDALPRSHGEPLRSPEEEARAGLDRFRRCLADVWKRARSQGRADLEPRLVQIAERGKGLGRRVSEDAGSVQRESRRLVAEILKVDQQLRSPRPAADGDAAGLLEGTR
jgi:hypothetical protein